MQRRRDSSGLNWKPHFTLGSLSEALLAGMSYDISVGTLSDVMPLLPGQVLIMSMSSGLDVYTAATLGQVSLGQSSLQDCAAMLTLRTSCQNQLLQLICRLRAAALSLAREQGH